MPADLGHPVPPPHPTRVAGGEKKNQLPFTRKVKPTAKKKPVAQSNVPIPSFGSAAGFDPTNPATWGAGLGAGQLSSIVKTQIGDAINPQVTGLQHEQDRYNQEQRAGQDSLTNYYKALATALGGEQGAVSNAYNGAAQAIGQVGQGLTGDAGKAMEAENADTQAILARGGQTQAVDYGASKANPGAAALNPFYSAHALSPAEGLAGTGAARATEAAAQPRIFASRGADALTAAIQKAVSGNKEYEQKITDIYTQVPALREKILAQVQDYETQQRQLKDTEIELGIKNQSVKADITAKNQSLKMQAVKLQADIDHWNAQLQDKSLDRATRLQIAADSRNAQRELVKLRGQQQRETAAYKQAHGIGSAALKGVTPATRSRWLKMADTFRYGVSPKQRYDSTTQKFVDVPGTGQPNVAYPVALARLMAAGATRRQAITILNTYYAPGEYGRGRGKKDLGETVVSPEGVVVK